MANLSGRVALILVAVAVLLVFLVGWFALISPEKSKANQVQAQVDQTRGTLQTTQQYIDDPKNKQNLSQLKALQTLLPANVAMSQVLRQLAAASAKAGVQIDSISPSTAVPGAGTAATPISLAVEGHYGRIARFIQILNQKAALDKNGASGTGLLYSVGSVTFSPVGSDAGADPHVLSSSIALNVYSYAAASTTPGVTATTPTTTTPASSDASP